MRNKDKQEDDCKTTFETKRSQRVFSLTSFRNAHDVDSFINFNCMDTGTFNELLQILGPYLKDMLVRKQKYITLSERLSLTFRIKKIIFNFIEFLPNLKLI